MTGTVGIALAAGLLSALMFLSLSEGLAIGLLLTYLAPLPLLMAGLARGAAMAVLAGAAACLAIALVSGGLAALPFGLAVVAPVAVIVRQALLWRTDGSGAVEWYPPGLLLGWLSAMAVTLIGLGAALISGQAGLGSGGLERWIAASVGHGLDLLAPTLDAPQRQAVADGWVPLFLALVGGSWLVMILVNTILAQGLLARWGHNRRPTPAYARELDLPTWLGGLLVAAAAAGALAEGDFAYLGRNVAVVVLVPFALSGLAAVHLWAAARPNARMILVAVYGVVFLASAWVLLPIAGLGLVRFVTRFRPAGDSGGGKEK
ncbi:hypothetical protein [Phaeospirillum tilakii]|uniref:Membrane protein DUF2232 n=1 Tax=Phaeospirillum tilakii TaxID=741673 RepID=A0ABW5C911_9PROT